MAPSRVALMLAVVMPGCSEPGVDDSGAVEGASGGSMGGQHASGGGDPDRDPDDDEGGGGSSAGAGGGADPGGRGGGGGAEPGDAGGRDAGAGPPDGRDGGDQVADELDDDDEGSDEDEGDEGDDEMVAPDVDPGELTAVGIITFEQVDGSDPVEGQLIGDQLQAEYGVRFSLADGTLPRIAQVGSPRTAFASIYGDDTPAPNEPVGTFFLTDDGTIEGRDAPALIVEYDVPTSETSGQILDIDEDETFTIEAIDARGTVLATVVIASGDERTGEGVASTWSFDLPEPEIVSVRFQGMRTMHDVFGLAFDNFNPRSSDLSHYEP